jgi:hypothetical protein
VQQWSHRPVQFCVSITGLKANTSYDLTFPAKTKYGMSSMLSKDISVTFTSTLDFVIPFKERDRQGVRSASLKMAMQSGVTSTQLVIYFPHGLAEGTAAKALEGRLRLNEIAAQWGGPITPVAVPFSVNITSTCALHAVSVPFQSHCTQHTMHCQDARVGSRSGACIRNKRLPSGRHR